jgi:serine/threonine protein kinase
MGLPEMKATFPKWKINGNEGLVTKAYNFKNDPDAMDLFTKMMKLEPSQRITVNGALQHPFFAQYNRRDEIPKLLPTFSPIKHSRKPPKTTGKSINNGKSLNLLMIDPPKMDG